MGKKKSLAEAKAEKVRKYQEKRKEEGKVDMEFPVSDSELRRRVCETEAQVDEVVARHMEAVEIIASKGGFYWLVLDVENFLIDYGTSSRRKMPMQWSWHEQEMRKEGVAEEEIEKRKNFQTGMSTAFSKLNPEDKVI